MREVNLIVIHCSATRPGLDVRAVDIDRWHKARGWGGIGYHWVITRSGAIEAGRPIEQIGAHAYGYNRNSIGICLVGGISEDGRVAEANFRGAQYVALEGLLHSTRFIFPHANICGHRDLSPDKDGDGIIERWEWTKECPCFDVAEWCKRHGINATGG